MKSRNPLFHLAWMTGVVCLLLFGPPDEPLPAVEAAGPAPCTAATEPLAAELAAAAVAVRAEALADATPALRTPATARPNQRESRGELLVHVRLADGTAVAGMSVSAVAHQGDDPPTPLATNMAAAVVTDLRGDARFRDLAPGNFLVQADPRATVHASAVVDPGTCVECTLELPARGVRGIVVDARDQPVPFAEVIAARWGHDDLHTPIIARCDVLGGFQVRGLDRMLLLGARAPGHGPSVLQFVDPAAAAERQVRLQLREQTAGLRGTVLDAEAQPVSGALVVVGSPAAANRVTLPDGGHGVAAVPQVALTDDNGSFQFRDLLPGAAVTVSAHAPAGRAWLAKVDLTPGEESQVVLHWQATASIAGKATTADAAPAADVLVEVTCADGPLLSRSCRTNSEGNYCIEALPATTVSVVAGGRTTGFGEARATLQVGTRCAVDLCLVQPRTLTGRVIDGEGRPIAECRVAAVGAHGPQGATTDPDGRFRIEHFTGDTAMLWIRAPEAMPADPVTRRFTGEELAAELTVVLQRRASSGLRGRIVDADGAGVAGANVAFLPRGAIAWRTQAVAADGSFVLGPLPAGLVDLRITAKGSGTVVTSHRLPVDADLDLGDVQLSPAARLAIELTRADGGKVANAHVRLMDSNGGFRELVACPNGSCSLDTLAPGPWIVTAVAPDCAVQTARVDVAAQQTQRVAFTLGNGVACRLRLPPKPPAGEAGSLVLHGPDGLVQAVFWDEAGGPTRTLELCLPPGDHVLQRSDGGGREFSFTVPWSGAPEFVVTF